MVLPTTVGNSPRSANLTRPLLHQLLVQVRVPDLSLPGDNLLKLRLKAGSTACRVMTTEPGPDLKEGRAGRWERGRAWSMHSNTERSVRPKEIGKDPFRHQIYFFLMVKNEWVQDTENTEKCKKKVKVTGPLHPTGQHLNSCCWNSLGLLYQQVCSWSLFCTFLSN